MYRCCKFFCYRKIAGRLDTKHSGDKKFFFQTSLTVFS
jgi:hypothetical protein